MPLKEVKNAQGAVIETRMMTKAEILTDATVHREDEVMQYQINIDNFELMIEELEEIDTEKRTMDQEDYLQELRARIIAEKREQSKVQLVLNALRKNLERA